MNKILSYLLNLYFRFPFTRQILWGIVSILLILLFFFSSLGYQKAETAPVGWEKGFQISPAGFLAKNVRAVSKGNYIVAVYEGKAGGVGSIFVSISFNGGRQFIRPIKVAETSSSIDCNPHVAISGKGHLVVVWQNLLAAQSETRLFYSVSTDMGAVWSMQRRVFISPGSETGMEMLPQAFYDDRGTLHLFYHAIRNSTLSFFHSSSIDEKVFSHGEVLVDVGRSIRGAFFPAIHVSGSRMFIVWQGKGERFGVLSDDLFFMRSGNYGDSWSSPDKITKSLANDASPSIVLFRDVLYLAYQNYENQNWSIMLLKGFDNGRAWDSFPVKISTTNANCFSPAVVGSANNELVISWYDVREKSPAIFARKYSLLERKLLAEVKLSGEKYGAWKPVTISLGKRIILFWEQGSRIVAKYSDIYVAPPSVSSVTHPRDRWSRSSSALIEWKSPKDESGVVGYATIQNKMPDFNPTIKSMDADVHVRRLTGLDDGVSYFHIRAIDGAGNLSRTIHYKIQVSKNPPRSPIVISPTHPEARSVKNRSPLIRWSVKQKDRLKGFLFALSKDPLKKPTEFTTEFKKSFSNLADGRYFFKIRSVDRANSFSSSTTYEIIVGKAEALDPATYEKIARDEKAKERKDVDDENFKRVIVPYQKVEIPFDISRPCQKKSFDALVVTRNIPRGNILGYSALVGTQKPSLPNRINLKNNILSVRDLRDGTYYLGVKSRYIKLQNGSRTEMWTRPTIIRFTVKLPEDPSPVIAFTNNVFARVEKSWLSITASLFVALFSVLTIGFGTKLMFYMKLMQYRFRSAVRIIF